MKIKLREQDIVNIVRKLLTEQELPPLADEFVDVRVESLVNNDFFEIGNISLLIDIGPYYTLTPYGGMEKLVLFDKDLFVEKKTYKDVTPSFHIEEFIRSLYAQKDVEKAGRGDIDIRKNFKQKFFEKYVNLIRNEISNSDCSIFRNDDRKIYVFSDHEHNFIASIVKYDSGLDWLKIYNTYLDYFHITRRDDFFNDMCKDAFELVFNFNGNVDISQINWDLRGIDNWTLIDSVSGKDVLNQTEY